MTNQDTPTIYNIQDEKYSKLRRPAVYSLVDATIFPMPQLGRVDVFIETLEGERLAGELFSRRNDWRFGDNIQ